MTSGDQWPMNINNFRLLFFLHSNIFVVDDLKRKLIFGFIFTTKKIVYSRPDNNISEEKHTKSDDQWPIFDLRIVLILEQLQIFELNYYKMKMHKEFKFLKLWKNLFRFTCWYFRNNSRSIELQI